MDSSVLLGLLIFTLLACALYVLTNVWAPSRSTRRSARPTPPRVYQTKPTAAPPSDRAPARTATTSAGTAARRDPPGGAARPATGSVAPHPAASAPVEALYGRLLTRTHADRAQAERLIRYEASRAPQASRAELIQNALDRWERDNR